MRIKKNNVIFVEQLRDIVIKLKNKIMTTIKNSKGTKAVNISTDATGTVNAMYVYIYNQQEQVIESKQYKRKSTAVKWANKMLGL